MPGTGLAIVAGRGDLPRLIAEDCARRGQPYRVVVFDGISLDWLGAHPGIQAVYEKPGRLFADLRAAGCTEVVFAGGMRRPGLNPLRFDLKMLSLAPKVLAGMKSGDDSALRIVARVFEAEGLKLRAAQEVLSGLLAPPGILTRTAPGDGDRADADRAARIVAALGAVDVGQAAVVAQGLCLGLESIQGTDALLDFVRRTGSAFRPDPDGPRGVLFKGPKPGQDLRMDLPAIGPGTVAAAVAAGLAGIAVQAGGTLIVGRERDGRRGRCRGDLPLGPRAGRMSGALRLFLIAGEPSGDLLGAGLLAGLRDLCATAPRIDGVGGPAMAAEGLASRFPMQELSIMGLVEVLPRAPKLLARIRQTADAVVAAAPDALITIDSPDFCLRVARRARRRLPALKVIHYVAPSVWAWRPGRAAKMARVVDHVLALLPFEPPYMEAAGMTCDFVGHPVAAQRQATPAEAAALRAECGIAAGAPLMLLLPGSRRGEIARIGPVFAEVARRLRQVRPDLAVLLPAAEVGGRGAARFVSARRRGLAADPRPSGPAGRRGGGAQAGGLRGRRRRACGLGHGQSRTRGRRNADGDRLPGQSGDRMDGSAHGAGRYGHSGQSGERHAGRAGVLLRKFRRRPDRGGCGGPARRSRRRFGAARGRDAGRCTCSAAAASRRGSGPPVRFSRRSGRVLRPTFWHEKRRRQCR